MYDLPAYDWALVLIGVIGIPALTCVALYRGALAAGLRGRTAAAVSAAAAILLGGWLVVTGLLAQAGAYRQHAHEIRPWLGLAAAGTLIALLLATRIPLVSRVLAAQGTPARLALPQTLRAIGAVWLVAMAQGYLPALFALPAGLGDVAIGVSAPFVARRLTRDPAHPGAVWFNVLGILDLVVAVGTASLAGLGSSQLLHVTPSAEALTSLPFALVPTAAVPLAVALHVVSLGRLLPRARARAGASAAEARSA